MEADSDTGRGVDKQASRKRQPDNHKHRDRQR